MKRFFIRFHLLFLVLLVAHAKTFADPLNPPILVRPINDTLVTISNPIFQWSLSTNDPVEYYKVQIATDTGFTQLVYDTFVQDIQRKFDLVPGIKYYWRVAGVNYAGTGAYSSPGSFKTDVTLTHYIADSDPSFFPFHIGDTWCYNHGSSWVNTIKTIVDTAENGKWKVMMCNYRYGTVDTNYEYWQYYDGTFSIVGMDPVYINYLAKDSTWGMQITSMQSYGKAWTLSRDTVFGQILDVQKYSYLYSGYGDGSTAVTIKAAKYLGIYYGSNSWVSWRAVTKRTSIDSLIGCQIGGVLRGIIPHQSLPAAPSALKPADKSKNVAVSTTLNWNCPDTNSVAKFRLQVAKDSTFTAVMCDTLIVSKDSITQMISFSLRTSNLDTNTTYYWHVQGINFLGAGDYSKNFSFTTGDYPITTTPTSAIPEGAVLEFPSMMKWHPPANSKARAYLIQVGINDPWPTWVALYWLHATDTCRLFTEGKSNTKYYWRVMASNNGNYGDYSAFYTFSTGADTTTIVPIAEIPTVRIPSGTRLDYPPTLKWQPVPAWQVKYYKLRIGTNYRNGTIISPVEATVADTCYVFLGASENKMYYWSVCAANKDTSGPYSDVYNFKTTSLLQNAPSVHDIDVVIGSKDTTVTFSWIEISNADVASYQLQIASDEGFTDIVYDNPALTETKVTLNKLEPYRTYYWHVRALNTYHSSPYSTTSSFKYGEPRVYQFSLEQNYPNPFNPKTLIKYSLPGDGFVSLKIYDSMGAEVRTLVSEYQTMNKYEVDVSMPDCPSGVYIYKLQQGNNIQSKKLILLK